MNSDTYDMRGVFMRAMQTWIHQYNARTHAIRDQYIEHSGVFVNHGVIFERANIAQHLFDALPHPIQAVHPHALYEHDADRFLEIGSYETFKEPMKYLIAWKRIKGLWLREFEAIVPYAGAPILKNGIEKTRRKWVELANQHHPQRHVEATYTANAWYLSHEKLSQGYTAIAACYSYMADPSFVIDLQAQATEDVQPDMVFEIGKWLMEGASGYYVIIWQQIAPDTWQIALDFNF